MASYGDFIIFADESGDHSLVSIDPQYPIFVLAMCLFPKAGYERSVVKWVSALKKKHFGSDQIILHERDIRKSEGAFKSLNDLDKRALFLSDLAKLITFSRFSLTASVIKKNDLNRQYIAPDNPYHLSAGFCLERLKMDMRKMGCTNGRAEVVFECRGRKEDEELELEFRRVCDGSNQLGERLPFDIRFEPKSANGAGLQFADMLARPIGRHILDPSQPNRAYDLLEPKFKRNSRTGSIDGWGLKVFP